VGVFPDPKSSKEKQYALELDEFDRGYPRLELGFLIDVVGAFRTLAEKGDVQAFQPRTELGRAHKDRIWSHLRTGDKRAADSAVSWRALLGKLSGLDRLKVFDRGEELALRYKPLLAPGTVSIVDLSDSGSPVLNNLVIADLLRGVQEQQDKRYAEAEGSGSKPSRVLIVIEEAHEFLSAERVDKMPILFEQVARIARRGRKRWLGLVFVTQLPQNLPRQLFGLVNSYVLHKIADPQVVATLQRTVSGIDESLWQRLPGLAPGQAIVAFPHLARPLLVAIDPAPCQLRLVD
jgi:hypothetical protein